MLQEMIHMCIYMEDSPQSISMSLHMGVEDVRLHFRLELVL